MFDKAVQQARYIFSNLMLHFLSPCVFADLWKVLLPGSDKNEDVFLHVWLSVGKYGSRLSLW